MASGVDGVSCQGVVARQGVKAVQVKSGKKDWSVLLSAASGGATGAYVCFPFEAAKKMLQRGVPLPFNRPLEFYRGSTSFSVSVTAATVAAMTFRHGLQQLPGYDSTSTPWAAFSAVFGGMLGATVGSTPVENIILYQQAHKCGPKVAIRELFVQGLFRPWVGLPELMMREAGFAGTFMWGGRAASAKVKQHTDSALIGGATELVVSLLGATCTQPFDALATLRQRHDGKLSSLDAIRLLKKTKGFRGFFGGLSGRAFLFTGCAVIIPRVEEVVRNFLDKK